MQFTDIGSKNQAQGVGVAGPQGNIPQNVMVPQQQQQQQNGNSIMFNSIVLITNVTKLFIGNFSQCWESSSRSYDEPNECPTSNDANGPTTTASDDGCQSTAADEPANEPDGRHESAATHGPNECTAANESNAAATTPAAATTASASTSTAAAAVSAEFKSATKPGQH